jgi:hypothetical protein
MLVVAIQQGALTESDAKFRGRTEALRAALQKIADDPSRPNNALGATTNLLLMRLHQTVDTDEFDAALRELKGVIEKIEGLADYPAESVADIIKVLGDVVSDSQAYNELFGTHPAEAAGIVVARCRCSPLEARAASRTVT